MMRADASMFQPQKTTCAVSRLPPSSPSSAFSIRALRSPDLLASAIADQQPGTESYRHDQIIYNESRSPRESSRLLATERDDASPVYWAASSYHPLTPPSTSSTFVPPNSHPPAYVHRRHPAPPSSSPAAVSPPASPAIRAMPPGSRQQQQPETRPMVSVRNPSIESATSSLSSASTSQPPDMVSLIRAAGSPEAALLAMWREKQSTSSHDAQLWRLVEKQRSMIIGLQKDLERALKDKDRYRKKLKEHVKQATSLPDVLHRSDAVNPVDNRNTSQSPSLSETLDEQWKGTDAKLADHGPYPLSRGAFTSTTIPESLSADPPTRSSALHFIPSSTSDIDNSFARTTHLSDLNKEEQRQGLSFDTTVPGTGQNGSTPEQPSPSEPQVSLQQSPLGSTGISIQTQFEAPQISLVHATPVLSESFQSPLPQKLIQPQRKAPPAPLNLSHLPTNIVDLHVAALDDEQRPDHDDMLETDQIPHFERGRRKTREEDDRIREAQYSKVEEARSKSKKQKYSSNSKPHEIVNTSTMDASGIDDPVSTVPPPSSSSPLLPFSPLRTGLPVSPRHPPHNLLTAMLSASSSDSVKGANLSAGPLGSPLASPGLPSSPRPSDRPFGSPWPRSPNPAFLDSSFMNTSAIVHPAQSTQQVASTIHNSHHSLVAKQDQKIAQLNDTSSTNSHVKTPPSYASDSVDVYRGLVSDEYPTLLLPPHALPSIQVQVFSSRLRPSRLSILVPKSQEEDPVFILAIYARSNKKQLWRVEKTTATLPALDAQLRSQCDLQGKLPDRSLFGGHAPAKIDARTVALNQYFDAILVTPMDETTALVICEYLSADVLGVQAGSASESAADMVSKTPNANQRKEGYLTKRGKNFGGWKARFFVLDGLDLKYFEVEGGAHLGTIKLQNAQIGKQSQQQSNQPSQRRDDLEDNQYRHAFLILEPKRKDSSSLVRHVLCAENDEERDAWVDALLQHVDYMDERSSERQGLSSTRLKKHKSSQEFATSRPKDSGSTDKQSRVQGLSYDDAVAAEAPIRGPSHRDAVDSKDSRGSPKMSSFSHDTLGYHSTISSPSGGAPIKDVGIWNNKPAVASSQVKDRKRSIFGFRGRGSSDLAPVQIDNQVQASAEQGLNVLHGGVFGIPLKEAVETTQLTGIDVPLPAVVYRCLEYLKAKQATNEEGIFRLSGSNVVIKGLRDRFNKEGDVKLLDGQYYDVHAIASLLKLYLRELPAFILTRDLHLDFLKVLDMDERTKKIQTFNVLVHMLPRVNLELLRHLSAFLIEIVDNSEINKMTVRNVGIVFAPTLNIPAPLISFFLTDHSEIFSVRVDEASSPIHELRQKSENHLGDDAIRSPRRQMFSDLPTPAYDQTTFSQRNPSQGQPQGQSHANSVQCYTSLQPSQQQQHHNHDSGFIPIRPTYDVQAYTQSHQREGFGGLNQALQPNNAREERQRRRESSMLSTTMSFPTSSSRKTSNSSSNFN